MQLLQLDHLQPLQDHFRCIVFPGFQVGFTLRWWTQWWHDDLWPITTSGQVDVCNIVVLATMLADAAAAALLNQDLLTQ